MKKTKNSDSKKDSLLEEAKSRQSNKKLWKRLPVKKDKSKTGRNDTDESNNDQETNYKDVLFAVMFLLHIVAIIAVGIVWGYNPYNLDEEKFHLMADMKSFAGMVLLLFLFATFSSTLFLLFIVKFPGLSLRAGLLSCVALSVGVTGLGIAQTNLWFFLMGTMGTILSAMHVYLVWTLLPAITVNLGTALLGILNHPGLFSLAYLQFGVLLVWTLWWIYVLIGVVDATSISYCDDFECKTLRDWYTISLLVVSYAWTYQIMQNVLHVTVSRTMGFWWYSDKPYDKTDCAWLSFCTAVSRSFGSICIGSLLLMIMQFTNNLANHVKKKNYSVLLCCAECVTDCFQGVVECFNEWAYVYVGIYEYSYLQAGKRAKDLFHSKGWSMLLTHNTVAGVLYTICGVVSLFTGLLGIVLGSNWRSLCEPNVFFLVAILNSMGVIIGFVDSRILMSVIISATNAIMVCFFEDPLYLARDHPEQCAALTMALEEFSDKDEGTNEVDVDDVDGPNHV